MSSAPTQSRFLPRPLALCALFALSALMPQGAEAQRAEWRMREPRKTTGGGVEREFPGNQWTFCRIRYTSGSPFISGPWYTDYPDSDFNFTLRLSEMTTIDVNPRPAIIELTDEALFDYPMIYMIEVGGLTLQDDEIEPLKTYLLRGGFLMTDDFWGENEWNNFEYEIGRVLPPSEFPIVNVPLDHEIFHCVFDIKEVPQVPAINNWQATGLTYERNDAKEAHCRGIFDRDGRLMVVAMHNTDLGDGWEREGENADYFANFSVPKAYPMGINIVTYAMTH